MDEILFISHWPQGPTQTLKHGVQEVGRNGRKEQRGEEKELERKAEGRTEQVSILYGTIRLAFNLRQLT